MKRYTVLIFLPVLLLLAFVRPVLISIQKTDTPSSVITKPNTGFNTGRSYSDSEIERCNINGHNALHTYPGSQRVPGHLTDNAKSLVITSLLSSSTGFSHIELFDNNYLSHNYPSHNFW